MKKTIKILKPFENFRCVGGECKHNCCVGWDIYIDKKTLEKYALAKGDFALKLKSGVDFKNSRFLMKNSGGEKRCAFLNDDNLCEIIINLGESYLCEVCKKHPRFYNVFGGFTEQGVGLACETAAKAFICKDDDLSLCADFESENLTAFERKILSFRKKMIIRATDKLKPLETRIKGIVSELCNEKDFFGKDFSKQLSLDCLDAKWKRKVKSVKIADESFMPQTEKYFERLLVYFMYRHIPMAADTLDLKSRTLFSVLSVKAIYSLYVNGGDLSEQGIVDAAREYSAETEYSDDNLNAVLDVLDEIVCRKNLH